AGAPVLEPFGSRLRRLDDARDAFHVGGNEDLARPRLGLDVEDRERKKDNNGEPRDHGRRILPERSCRPPSSRTRPTCPSAPFLLEKRLLPHRTSAVPAVAACGPHD